MQPADLILIVETSISASYVDVCYRDDPKVAECLIKDIEKLIPKFKSGELRPQVSRDWKTMRFVLTSICLIVIEVLCWHSLIKKGLRRFFFAWYGLLWFLTVYGTYFPWLCWSSCMKLNSSRNKVTKYTSSEVLVKTLRGGLRLEPVPSHTTLDCIYLQSYGLAQSTMLPQIPIVFKSLGAKTLNN